MVPGKYGFRLAPWDRNLKQTQPKISQIQFKVLMENADENGNLTAKKGGIRGISQILVPLI